MSTGFYLTENEALPAPCRGTRAAVIRLGEQVRAEVGLTHGFDLWALLDANQGEIVQDDLMSGEALSRGFEMAPDGRFRIHVSPLRSARSNNMVIARELGHRVLHKQAFDQAHPGKTMVAPRQMDGHGADQHRCKWEGLWFAQGLLLPEAELMDIVRDRGLEDAATRFGVTPAAVKLRVERIERDIPVETPSPELN